MKKHTGMFVVVAVVVILGCWVCWLVGFPFPRTDINQEIEIDNVCLGTYKVSTRLWIHRNGDVILDKWYCNKGLKCADIPRIKTLHMESMIEREKAIKECFKNFEDCENQ